MCAVALVVCDLLDRYRKTVCHTTLTPTQNLGKNRSTYQLFTPCATITVGGCLADIYSLKKLRNSLSWTTTFWKRWATNCPGQPHFDKAAQPVVLDKYFLEKLRS